MGDNTAATAVTFERQNLPTILRLLTCCFFAWVSRLWVAAGRRGMRPAAMPADPAAQPDATRPAFAIYVAVPSPVIDLDSDSDGANTETGMGTFVSDFQERPSPAQTLGPSLRVRTDSTLASSVLLIHWWLMTKKNCPHWEKITQTKRNWICETW